MAASVNTAFYDLLGVQPTATVNELRSAYKRKALQLHPDKGGDPEHFKSMKAAYDVLSDPQKRAIYDAYGAEAVNLMDGNMPSPTAVWASLSRRNKIIVVLAVMVISLVIMSPLILLSLRWDGRVGWSWFVALAPLFAFETIALIIVLVTMKVPPAPAEEDGAEVKAQYDEARRTTLLNKCKAGSFIGLMILVEVFTALRLQGLASWSWFVVLSPWMVLELAFILKRVIAASPAWEEACTAAKAARAAGTSRKQPPGFLSFTLDQVGWNAIRLVTVLLVAARADMLFTGSWYICITPAIVAGVSQVFLACCARPPPSASAARASAAGGAGGDAEAAIEEEVENDQETIQGKAEACSTCCFVFFWLLMACFAAGKLNGNGMSSFVVFSPLFLSVCCTMCLPLCLLAAGADTGAEGEEARSFNGAEGSSSYGAAGAAPKAKAESGAATAMPLFAGP